MTTYGPDDLRIWKGLEIIRERPEMFAGQKPWGPSLSANLVKDLVYLNALPATVSQIGEWWLVSSKIDWLSSGDTISIEPFLGPARIPERGQYAIRSESIIAALASVLVTAGKDGLKWIVGDDIKFSLPAEIEQQALTIESGRFVAFKFADE